MTDILNRRQVLAGTVVAAAVAMVAEAAHRPSLEERIGAYRNALAAYEAALTLHGDDVYDLPEWTEFERAERAVIDYRCTTLEEVRTKVATVLGSPGGLLDTVKHCTRDGESELARLLRSMVA